MTRGRSPAGCEAFIKKRAELQERSAIGDDGRLGKALLEQRRRRSALSVRLILATLVLLALAPAAQAALPESYYPATQGNEGASLSATTLAAPTVDSVFPADAATVVPLNVIVTLEFSQPMDGSSLNSGGTVLLLNGTEEVPGQVAVESSTTVKIYPDSWLDTNTAYSVLVTTAARDVEGNQLAAQFESSFTTTATGQAPHGNYLGTGNSCRQCHGVHGAAESGTFGGPLLRADNENSLCTSCHDGTGASTDIRSDFADATSGHELEDAPPSSTGPGLSTQCSSCHGPHFAGSMQPGQYSLTINDRTVGGNDYTWCQACHDDQNSWGGENYPYPAGGPSSSKPARDPDGYPVSGTFPGAATYNNPAANAHSPSSGNVVWPGSERASGDCRNCHASHGNQAKYDSLVAEYRPTPDAASVVGDRRDGTYAALCLTCHDGSPAASNMRQFLSMDYDKTGPDYTGGHRIFTEGGKLPAGSPLPCYDCHNPHGSKGNDGANPNESQISDEQWSNIDTSTTRGIVDFCTKCHLPWEYVAGSGQPEANQIPAGQLSEVEGLDRRAAANKLSLTANIQAHGKANMVSATTSCYDCHGNSYQAVSNTEGYNVHRPSPGSCTGCHASAQDAGDGGPTRRAVVGEFAAGGGHHVVGAEVTDKDCGVCHLEGDAISGGLDASVHRNNAIDLRNPDTGDATGLAAFASFNRDTSSATLESWVTAVQSNLCLKCHDSDGAASVEARTPSAAARQPFSANSRDAANTLAALNPANSFDHAVLAPGANPYATALTMMPPWNQSGLGPSTISCFDCHVSTAGHGGQFGKMARTNIGNPPSAPNYTGMRDLCLRCHRQTVYEGSSSASRFVQHADSGHRLGAVNPLGCRGCHAGLTNNTGLAGNGAPGDIHGGNYLWPGDTSPAGSAQYFLYGGWLGGWSAGNCWSACHEPTGY